MRAKTRTKVAVFVATKAVGEKHFHEKKATEWLPMIHIMIGDIKTFINETFICV